MLSNTVQLRNACRVAKALTPAQKVFQHVESVADLHEENLRVVRMKHEHIPLALPVYKHFWSYEYTARSVGIVCEDQHLYPVLFDCLRDPYSYLILKDDEPSGHILQYALFKNKEDDKRILPQTPMNLHKGDKYTFLDDFVHYYEDKSFELNPEATKIIHMFGGCVLPKGEGKGWFSAAAKAVGRENLKLHAKGFSGTMAVTTRRGSQKALCRSGFEIVHEPTLEMYKKCNNGTPVKIVENGTPATLVFMDFKKNLDNPMFKL